MKQIIDNKYRIIDELGHGASSTVFLVEDADGSRLALKLLNRKIREKKIERLKNEFRLMRSLNHPNIARVYDFGFDDKLDNYYFTLEYLSEGNFYLFNKLHKKDEVLLKTFYQLLCGLSYLHANNFIHFDITPNNVLVTRDSNGEYIVKITDFGLTEQFEPADHRFAGTLNFMSPEMIQGRKGLDQRTDLFSAGLILLYYLIESECYLPASSVEEFVKIRQEFDGRIIREKINCVADFRFQLLLSRLLEIDPAARLSNAEEAIVLLNHSFQTVFPLPQESGSTVNFSEYSLFRKNELDKIISLFSAAKICKNYFVVVSGEKGSGKGRILEEFKLHNQLNKIRIYHVSFPEHGKEPFFALKSILKNMFYLYQDTGSDYAKQLSELIFDRQLSTYTTDEKIAFYQKIILLAADSFNKHKTVIVVDNLEFADRESLLFINYFVKNHYQATLLFLTFFINPRLIKENHEEYRQLFALKNSLVKIELTELNIEQIKEVVNCFFNHISDIPENLYREIQTLTGTNISRLIKFLKYLYDENVVVKSLRGYTFSHFFDFPEIVRNFVRQEIAYNESSMTKEPLAILQPLAISLTALTIAELAKISGLSVKDTENALNQLFDRFFIRHLYHEQNSYLIYEPAIKRVISSTIPAENRKNIHRAIALAIKPQRGDVWRYKRLMRILHFLLGSSFHNQQLPDFKLRILKEILYLEHHYDIYFNFCHLLIAENENLRYDSRIYLLSEIAAGSLEKKCRFDYTETVCTFLAEFKLHKQLTQNEDIYFKYLLTGLLYHNYQLTEKSPTEFLELLCRFLHGNYSGRIRTMNLFLTAYERFFAGCVVLPYIENLLEAMKSDPDLEAEYYFVRLIAISYTKSIPEQTDIDFTDDFFREITSYFARIKSGNNPDLVVRTYLIISGFYKNCDYDAAVLELYREAEHYFTSRGLLEALFALKNDLVNYFQRNMLFTNALTEINQALQQIVRYQDLEKLSGLIKKRVQLKFILEENVSIVVTDYNLLLEFLHKQKSETAEIYEGLINLHLDAGSYKDVFETLKRYLKSMNRELNLSKRSREFYLKKLLKYYNVSQLRNLSSALLLDLNWSDDDFLENIIDIKTQSHIMESKQDVSWKDVLSNALICKILNNFQQTEKNDYCDIFLQICEKYDQQTMLYKRARQICKILDGSYKSENVEFLRSDLNVLYGKGYYNTARNLAAEIAKVLFFIYRDEKNFLLMAELAFKISGDLYYSTDSEFRHLIKDENFQLLNDLVRDIKNRYKKK